MNRAFLTRPNLRRSRLLLTAAGLGLGLPLLFNACERHPAGEPALWYGHGSAKPASKDPATHGPDGWGRRFTDSQGTEIAPPEEHHGGEHAAHPGEPAGHEAPNPHAAEPAKH